MEESDIVIKLKQLGEELSAVADDKLKRQEKIHELEGLLGSMQVKDFPELSDSPTIQKFVELIGGREGLKPGEVKRRGTLAQIEREWTLQDILGMVARGEMDLVAVTPAETLTLTFNGVPFQIFAHEECRIPRCFYDIYKNHMHAMKQAGIHERYLMGKSDELPDRNWVTDESAAVRAWSMLGEAHGVRGGTLGTGKINLGEEEGK